MSGLSGKNLHLSILSAFFHDIGKGYDCIYDMYSTTKYNSQGEASHPTFSGDVILGLKRLKVKSCSHCQVNHTNGKTSAIDNHSKCDIFIPALFRRYFPTIDIRKVALAAYMHYEFGKLNMDPSYGGITSSQYVVTFKNNCKKVNLKPTKTLIKMCIAVSCADIAGASNVRLVKNKHLLKTFTPAKEIYHSKDPWVAFGMDKKYLQYRTDVLNEFEK